MNLQDVAKKLRVNTQNISEDIIFRWSAVSMTGEGVSEEELAPLLEAARWAPSSFNSQEWVFYYSLKGSREFDEMLGLMTDKNKEKYSKSGALLILSSLTKSEHNGKYIRTHSLDTGMAFQNFAIEGVRRNLVVHPMGGFDYDRAKDYLGLNDSYSIECMIAVGKPSDDISENNVSDRKKLSEVGIKFKS